MEFFQVKILSCKINKKKVQKNIFYLLIFLKKSVAYFRAGYNWD